MLLYLHSPPGEMGAEIAGFWGGPPAVWENKPKGEALKWTVWIKKKFEMHKNSDKSGQKSQFLCKVVNAYTLLVPPQSAL